MASYAHFGAIFKMICKTLSAGNVGDVGKTMTKPKIIKRNDLKGYRVENMTC